jgi:hypothetical protein
MSKGLIDNSGLDAAVKWSLKAQERGDRFLKEFGVKQIIEAYLNGLPTKFKDDHLENMIRRCNEELQQNHPVMAWTWLRDIRQRLIDREII